MNVPRVILLVLVMTLLVMSAAAWWMGARGAMIAHAGGGFQGQVYTNSLAAMDANYARGFRLFEIDLAFTADGTLVCAHDWGGFGGKAPDYTDWLAAAETEWPCQAASLSEWFRVREDAALVTDVKDTDQGPALDTLKAAGMRPGQTIVQIYHPEEHGPVAAAGFDRQILTLYRYRGEDAPVLALAEAGKLEGITVPEGMARQGYALKVNGTPVYTHTVNSRLWSGIYRLLGVDGVYTDFLRPASAQEKYVGSAP